MVFSAVNVPSAPTNTHQHHTPPSFSIFTGHRLVCDDLCIVPSVVVSRCPITATLKVALQTARKAAEALEARNLRDAFRQLEVRQSLAVTPRISKKAL